jgi:hypothetical protein
VPITPSVLTDPNRWVPNPPDVELIVARYLREQLGTDFSARSFTELPPGEPFATPVVRCQRIGGVWRIPGYLDDAQVDVDVWSRGDFTTVTKPLASRVRGLLFGARGVMRDGGVITNVYEIAGLARRPEPDDPTLGRLGFTVGVLVRPT